MTLIDFTYINSHGGLNIAQYVLEYLREREDYNDFLILLDKRNFLKLKTYNLKYNVIYKNEISRFIFYLKYKTSFDSMICFANVPPPIKQNIKVKVYFHNELLLSTKGAEMTLIKKIILFFKKQYIRRLDFGYSWHVQTSHLKKLISSSLNIKEGKIFITPIFKEIIINKKLKIPNTFLYPTSNSKHKNNERLISAFILASRKVSDKITLKLTIGQPKKNDYVLPKNLEIKYLGQLKHKKLINHYAESKYLIFPSLKESFGLPLVEGIQSGCIILSSDLNFSHEILETKYLFNPYKIEDMAEKITLALKSKDNSSQTLKVSNLINKIFENEV
ncbi:MAG: glycosyltransferase [Flavobacteriaceae bacterium]